MFIHITQESKLGTRSEFYDLKAFDWNTFLNVMKANYFDDIKYSIAIVRVV